MPQKNASTSPAGGGAIRFPLPIEPCERRRDCKISKADAAPGSVGNNSIVPVAQTAHPEKRRPALVWLSLLVILPLVLVTGAQITARIALGAQKQSPRLGWYVHSGQWLADLRTIGAACQLIMEDDAPAPGNYRSTTNQMVGNSPKIVAPGSELQNQEETVIN